ncbi:outer membrane protein assembly factor BamD [Cardiobacteriales bacterium ML27]|uniref:Outer membrane protein assembly factor BamD n=2 Tax=Ostreibacterium oceani TaxID=2654998 RepID=A0A6N7EX80_9GAMM|nr:outer membrane protein assembly factor BamD [Ostreibacterium oceani]
MRLIMTRVWTTPLLALTVTGCVSTADFEASQQRIAQLNTQLGGLEKQVMDLQAELSVVKAQRPIRLPTGTPIPPGSRNNQASGQNDANASSSNNSGNSSSNSNMSDEASAYHQALALYQSGDTDAAISAFENYNSRYPNADNLPNVLYYLGQASFVQRDYGRAEQVLEQLIYQYPMSQVDPRAPELLRRIYQHNNRADKIETLDNFLNTMNQSNLANPNNSTNNPVNNQATGQPALLN